MPKRKATAKTTTVRRKRTSNMSLTGGSGDVNPQFITTNHRFSMDGTIIPTFNSWVFFWSKTDILTFPGTILTTSSMQNKILVPEILSVIYDTTMGINLQPQSSLSPGDITWWTLLQSTICMGDKRKSFPDDHINAPLFEELSNDTATVDRQQELNFPLSALIDVTKWDTARFQRSNVGMQILEGGRELAPGHREVDLTDGAGHGLVCFSNNITLNTRLSVISIGETSSTQISQTNMVVRIFYRLKKITLQELLVGQQTFALTN